MISNHKKQLIPWLIVGTVVTCAGVAFAWPKIAQQKAERTADSLQATAPIPVEVAASSTQPASTPAETTAAAPAPLPTELNISVPFTTQAPTANWDAEHEQLCEEASALMVGRHFAGRAITDAADAEAGMQTLVDWENQNLGTMESTTAEQTAATVRAVYGLAVELKQNPTVDDLKQALADGKLIMVPAAGQKLKNPYFTAPGPLYHMLVVKGYTKAGNIVTNDPGTRHGADYVYDSTVFMNAIGDWNNGDPANGKKVVLVVSE